MSEQKRSERETVLHHAFEHGVNFQLRTILINGAIDESTFMLVDAALTQMEADSKKGVIIKINSPGGGVYDALAIVGRICASPRHITTEGYGQIMSAACLVLACGDKRKISKYAWFMHHEGSLEVSGKVSELEHHIKQEKKEELAWADCMAQFSNRSCDFWLRKGKGLDFYISANECLEFKIVDEII